MNDEQNLEGRRTDEARRDFLKVAGAVGAGLVAGLGVQNTADAVPPAEPVAPAPGNPSDPPRPAVAADTGTGDIPRRPLGRTSARVSIIGVGGHHLGDIRDIGAALRLVHEAIDAGVNFFDNCWEYWNGKSEDVLGRALKGRRDRVFLMTKVCTHGRGKDVALRQLEQSLRRLQTDHFDLWQVHGVVYENVPDLHFARDGVIEALDQAKRQGKTRYVGFTGHKQPSIHLRMLAHDYPFDSVQMPLNPFDGTYRSFERNVLPEANRRGIAALGMKSLGGNGQPVLHGIVTAQEALRNAMSLPVATTISGIDSFEVLHQNLAVAQNFRPMSAQEMQALRDRCAPYAADGHLELYKSTVKYDGAVGRQQHGYPTMEEMPM
jgi:aryl-alcohol dehydrogenase-like predicted oxidoreductase